MKDLKPHISIALTYFIMAALLGLLLRSFPLVEIPITYKFFVHTHSHIALLGWVYVALTTLIYKLFVQNPVNEIKYRKIFWFTQLTLIGMLLTFPFQGYALFSIVFSTLFLFASYWFFWFFNKHVNQKFKKNQSYKCIKAALWFMVFSSIGPWLLGIIMNILGAQSIWYRLAIYFYLHFQYNGWMILALIGLFLFVLDELGITLSKNSFKKFFWGIILGIMFSFFLSTLFAKPSLVFNILGAAGGILQLFAFGILVSNFSGLKRKAQVQFSKIQVILLVTVVILMVFKMVLQLFTALPYFAELASVYLDFTVGYLHLTFLGVVTMGLFFFLNYFKLIEISRIAYLIYFTGFVITEGLIFYKGIAAWQEFSLFTRYNEVLTVGSLLISLSLIAMAIRQRMKRNFVNDRKS